MGLDGANFFNSGNDLGMAFWGQGRNNAKSWARSQRLFPESPDAFMVCSTAGKAGGYVKFSRTAVWPGNIATPFKLLRENLGCFSFS